MSTLTAVTIIHRIVNDVNASETFFYDPKKVEFT